MQFALYGLPVAFLVLLALEQAFPLRKAKGPLWPRLRVNFCVAILALTVAASWAAGLLPSWSRVAYGVQWIAIFIGGVVFILLVTPVAPIGSGVWGDTRVELAALGHGADRPYRDAFTGMTLEPKEGIIPAARLFERFPVALLST